MPADNSVESKKVSARVLFEKICEKFYSREKIKWMAIVRIGKFKGMEILCGKGMEKEIVSFLKDRLKNILESKLSEGEVKGVHVIPLKKKESIQGYVLVNFIEKPEERVLEDLKDYVELACKFFDLGENLNLVLQIDQITGLKNLAGFLQTLKEKIELFRFLNARLLILTLDIKNFSFINRRFGYLEGNRILKELAERFLKVIKEEGGEVFRTGADEFSMLLPIEKSEDIELRLKKIWEVFKNPVKVGKSQLELEGNIGAVVFPEDGEDVFELAEKLGLSLKKAKEMPKDSVFLYQKSEWNKVLFRIKLLEALKKAYQEKNFILYFQPRISLLEKRIVGVEALLRWKHPQKGIIPPAEFISVLENSELIYDVGKWVVEECARTKNRLQKEGCNLRISFNVSVNQILKSDLVEDVKTALEKAGVEPECFEVEVTEFLFFYNFEKGFKTLQKLSEMGIKISIDDFGTGYSSFLYFKQLPAHILKIDREFIKGLPDSKEDSGIVMAVNTLAKNLDKKVLAEGVEKKEQLVFLKGLQIDEVQGFYFAPPLPEDKLLQFVSIFKPEIYFW